MKYNQYTWNLYKQTTIGKEMIQFFSDAKGYTLFSRYCPHAYFISEDLYNDWLENIYCYGVSDYDHEISGSLYQILGIEQFNRTQYDKALSYFILGIKEQNLSAKSTYTDGIISFIERYPIDNTFKGKLKIRFGRIGTFSDSALLFLQYLEV